MVTATDIERSTCQGTQGLVGAVDGYDWSIRESRSGRCEVRVCHGEPGNGYTCFIVRRVFWVNVPQVIANYINNGEKKG